LISDRIAILALTSFLTIRTRCDTLRDNEPRLLIIIDAWGTIPYSTRHNVMSASSTVTPDAA